VGRGGRPCSPVTCWRWIKNGVRTIDGRVVKLFALRCGARWVVPESAIENLIRAQTPGLDESQSNRVNADRARTSQERAAKEPPDQIRGRLARLFAEARLLRSLLRLSESKSRSLTDESEIRPERQRGANAR